jgi:acetoin:2,6-dichlorophenolindophenol oxidoreductase subunit beta
MFFQGSVNMNLTYGEAIREALFAELEKNQDVVMFGQDIQDNLYGYTRDLAEIFGKDRIINTPLSEAAVVGTAIGAAMCGIRTVIDLTISPFLYVAMDQIVSLASKTTYMYDGQFKLPITIMCSSMYNGSNSAQHSDRPHPIFMNTPGLKVIAPATPQDAYSLHRAAIADDNPVICFTDRSIFYNKEEVDLGLEIKLGDANIINKGTDVSIITISGTLPSALAAMEELNKDNISAEIIDVRSLVPLDKKSILDSVKKTGRVVIVDTANKTCSAASEISSIIAEHAFCSLNAPIGIVSYDDVPIPFAKELEVLLMPTKEKILAKARHAYNYGKPV